MLHPVPPAHEKGNYDRVDSVTKEGFLHLRRVVQ